jgi:hypothetical protein
VALGRAYEDDVLIATKEIGDINKNGRKFCLALIITPNNQLIFSIFLVDL